VAAIGPARALATPLLIEHAAAAGLTVHPWTINEPDEIRRFLAAGVASITTDEPDAARKLRDEAPAPAPIEGQTG
jgi:glycerophosphoryl diester phosphodiesterase